MLTPPSSFEPFPHAALQGSIVDRFREIAARHADRVALRGRERKLTYAELAALVGKVAGNLARELAGRAGPVAILMPHDSRFPAAILSVLAAARIQVPLDPTHPIDRNRVIAEGSGAAALLSIGDVADQTASLFPPRLPVLDFDRLAATGSSASLGDAHQPRRHPPSFTRMRRASPSWRARRLPSRRRAGPPPRPGENRRSRRCASTQARQTPGQPNCSAW